MAAIQFPSAPTEGQELTATNGRKVVYTGGRWKSVIQSTGAAGLTEAEVTTIATTVTTAAVAALNLDNMAGLTEAEVTTIATTVTTAAVAALNLGNMSTADMIVSASAPDNAVGDNGDLWMQTV